MIEALILDVDGVIVGDRPGVNLPLPHDDVIERFKRVKENGLPIVLCTAKFGPAVHEIITRAGLDNPHITDNGAAIIDPINGRVVRQHAIARDAVKACIDLCLSREVPVEAYTVDRYYSHGMRAVPSLPDLPKRRLDIIQREPEESELLREIDKGLDAIKLISFIDPADKDDISRELDKLDQREQINYIWTQHPRLQPILPLVITAANVSKAVAAREVMEYLGISLENVLGVGDSASDWGFMKLCGFVATLANGDSKIKELVSKRGGFTASHVNDNGMIDILNHFNL